MLRADEVSDNAVDIYDFPSREVIMTVWRAAEETDTMLLIRSRNIAYCINEEIRKRRGYREEEKQKTP